MKVVFEFKCTPIEERFDFPDTISAAEIQTKFTDWFDAMLWDQCGGNWDIIYEDEDDEI